MQIHCGFRRSGARSCLTRQRRTGSNCATEVSRVDWDRYIQTRRDNAMQLQCLCTVLQILFQSTLQYTLSYKQSTETFGPKRPAIEHQQQLC